VHTPLHAPLTTIVTHTSSGALLFENLKELRSFDSIPVLVDCFFIGSFDPPFGPPVSLRARG
jgi:hypothetical protein